MALPKELTTVTGFSKFFALFLFIALPILTFLLGMNAKRVPKIGKLQESSIISPTPTPVYTSPPRIPLPLVYSTNADFVLRPEIAPQWDGSYELIFSIGHRSENTELVTEDVSHADPQKRVIWREKINDIFKDRLDRFAKEYEPLADDDGKPSLATWSSNDKKIALYLPDKIIIMDISTSSKKQESQGHTFNTYVITASMGDIISIPILEEGIYNPKLFFSGDGSALYYKATPDLMKYQRIELATRKVSEIDVGDPFPIPHADGFVYWEESNSYEEHSMVVYTDNTKKRYTIRQPFDFGGKILLSPQRDKVCYENGSLGYHGYTIYNLEEERGIEYGIQYSNCVKWLDNTTMVVKETPYYFPGYSQYFTFNTQTRQKILLHQELHTW